MREKERNCERKKTPAKRKRSNRFAHHSAVVATMSGWIQTLHTSLPVRAAAPPAETCSPPSSARRIPPCSQLTPPAATACRYPSSTCTSPVPFRVLKSPVDLLLLKINLEKCRCIIGGPLSREFYTYGDVVVCKNFFMDVEK